jgi:hypothetical protein
VVLLSPRFCRSRYFSSSTALWSMRNLDLVGLILLAPGLLAVEYGGYKASVAAQELGYIWIFTVSGMVPRARMLFDSIDGSPAAPRSKPDGGRDRVLGHLTARLPAGQRDHHAAAAGRSSPVPWPRRRGSNAREAEVECRSAGSRLGPGYPAPLPLAADLDATALLQPIRTAADVPGENRATRAAASCYETTARDDGDPVSQLAIVAGMVVIGWRHFEGTSALESPRPCSTCLLPYTAIDDRPRGPRRCPGRS